MKQIFIALLAASLAIGNASASVSVTVNGVAYTIPQKNEKGWGDNVTSWIQAISANTIQPTGGTFTLSSDLDLGASFGLKSVYFKSRSSNIASSGQLRLANTDTIQWRNSGNSGNYSLGVGSVDGLLSYNSIDLVNVSSSQTLTNKTLTAPVISSIVNTGTLTLPTSTDTLIGRNTTDTLTNKTLTSPVISSIVNTGTLTLPTSTDTLVGRATTDTLTNKTLTSPVISTISNTGTLTLPTSTDTLVGRATTDTLTNKSLSGSNNTFTNIPANTALTSQVPIANGGTGQSTKTAAFDALSPNSSSGDITYHNGTNNVRLAAGSNGQFLKLASGIPSWATVTSTNPVVQSKTTTYTILSTDDIVLGDATSAGFTLTLPSAATAHFLYISKIDSTSNLLTIARAGSDTISLGTSTALTSLVMGSQGDDVILYSDGVSKWYVTRFGINANVRLHMASNFGLGNNTTATITTFTSADLDPLSQQGSNGIVVKYPGTYVVTGRFRFPSFSSSGTNCQSYIKINSTTYTVGYFVTESSVSSSFISGSSIVAHLNAGDVVVVQGFQNSGTTLTIPGGDGTEELSIARVGN